MKVWLRLVFADGVVIATLLHVRPWRWSYAFVALLYPFYIESEIRYAYTTTEALLLRFYCALVVSATIPVILTKISNGSGIAFQWNGGVMFPNVSGYSQVNSPISTGRRSRYAHDDLGFSLKLFQIAAEA